MIHSENAAIEPRGSPGDPRARRCLCALRDRRDAEGQKSLFTEDTHFVVYMEGQGV